MRRAETFLWVGQGLDCVTFLALAQTFGINGEANPFVGFAIGLGGQTLGLAAIVAIKVVAILWVLQMAKLTILRGHPRFGYGVIVWGGLAGLIGAGTNVWGILAR